LIVVAVPPALVVTGFRALAHEWFVHFEYGRDGFPRDRYGLSTAERTDLALTGLRSIQPGGEGIELLRRAALPDGTPAFDARELRHMEDVRKLLGLALRGQLAVLLGVVALAVALGRTGAGRLSVPRGLLAGALVTLGLALLAVPVLLLGFDGFFLGFHRALFDGDTWRFSSTDTLLRLYPEAFWQHTAQLVAAITVAQALVLAGASWWWLRRVGRA
jgi:integral membrane protein (TIGR01906 family)